MGSHVSSPYNYEEDREDKRGSSIHGRDDLSESPHGDSGWEEDYSQDYDENDEYDEGEWGEDWEGDEDEPLGERLAKHLVTVREEEARQLLEEEEENERVRKSMFDSTFATQAIADD